MSKAAFCITIMSMQYLTNSIIRNKINNHDNRVRNDCQKNKSYI